MAAGKSAPAPETIFRSLKGINQDDPDDEVTGDTFEEMEQQYRNFVTVMTQQG